MGVKRGSLFCLLLADNIINVNPINPLGSLEWNEFK